MKGFHIFSSHSVCSFRRASVFFGALALFASALCAQSSRMNARPDFARSLAATANEPITFEDIHYCGEVFKNATPSLDVRPETLPDDGSLWRVGSNRWSEAREKHYSQWFRQNVDTEFLVRYGLKADCADTAATIRAIYSHIYRLPFLLKSSTTSKGIGHFSKEFSSLPTSNKWNEREWQTAVKEDRRFRAFLVRIGDTVSAQNFWINSYPVIAYDPLNPDRLSEYIRPGVLHNRASHVKIISDVDSLQWFPIHQLSATTPASVQALSEYDDIELGPPEGTKRGIVAWNWVVNCGSKGWQHVASERMPGYSLQQSQFVSNPPPGKEPFDSPGSYYERIARAKSLKHPSRQTVERLISQLGTYLRNRVPKTFEVQRLLISTNGRIAKDRNFDENYSTETMDQMIERRFAAIESLIVNYGPQIPMTYDQFVDLAMSQEVDLNEYGKTNLFFFVIMKRYFKMSFDPRSAFQERWGLNQFQLIRGYYNKEQMLVPKLKAEVQLRLRYNEQRLDSMKSGTEPIPAQGIRTYYKWLGYDRNQLAELVTREALAQSGLTALQRLGR